MRSTLFYIPHSDPFFDIPVFGVGWVLALLIIIGLTMIILRAREQGWKNAVINELPLYLILGAAVVWGAPLIEERSAAGEPLGIPIRSYGVMVLLGIVTGVALLAHESRRMGLHPDLMFSLAFWMVISGFVGARIFYVTKYWPQFSAPTWSATLGNIAKLTDGGLVVYGAFIGATLAVLVFLRRNKLPILAVTDLLGPSLMLGLAFGRIGCFMNGCCWGGICDDSFLAVTFPQGSPPFVDQIENGTLLDMRFDQHPDNTYTIREVKPGGLGDRAGLKEGDVIAQILLPDATAFSRMRHGEDAGDALLSIMLKDGRRISWEFRELPRRTEPIYPTQILSSINAGLICLFLWSYYPLRQRDGEVTALLVSIYPVTRILLEMIRIDEPSVLAISYRLTISQSISIGLLLAVVGLWIYVLAQPKQRALPPATPTNTRQARSGK